MSHYKENYEKTNSYDLKEDFGYLAANNNQYIVPVKEPYSRLTGYY